MPATFSVVDTESHGPIIQIRTLEVNDANDVAAKHAINDYITSGKPWWEDLTFRRKEPSRVVPLYMLDKVASGWSLTSDAADGVRLYAAPSYVRGIIFKIWSRTTKIRYIMWWRQ